jgi:signal transduction histidine kinase/HAMP domain-containing protein
MKNRIILSMLLLFGLFTTGSGLSLLFLYNTTTNLQSVINLHRVEIIRQELVINAQSVQSHLYSFGTTFGKELDVIVDNVIELDNSARRCQNCHHQPDIAKRLEEVVSLVDQYQDALSYLITTSANEDRIKRLQLVAIGIGTTVLDRVQDMALIAGKKLNDNTMASVEELQRSRNVLVTTLVLSFLIAVIIAVTITKQVVEPVEELVDATRKIQSGELGYTTSYSGKNEFRELIHSFNEMSMTLNENNQTILQHLNGLSNLYSVTLTFHAITDATDIYRRVSRGVADLVGAEQAGLMLIEGDNFLHKYPAVGLDQQSTKLLTLPKETVQEMYVSSSRRAYIKNEGEGRMPFGAADKKLKVRNVMLVWLRQQGKVVGALRVANKRKGDFTTEDVHPLAILANNISVALENANLYDDLKKQMLELKQAQEQLVQAAKLVAIGELASNVAHELNNPLTTVLGYAELMREEDDPTTMMSDLKVIENECLRAKDIVRQLLEFARKRDLSMKIVDVKHIIDELIELVSIHTRNNNITINTFYGDTTQIAGDENQLKQVFLNIINNAFHAMEEEAGVLDISSSSDQEMVHVRFENTGPRIQENILNRIFEPFFSTKREKGTGLGLSVSYKIIKSHEGDINVESPIKDDNGAAFTISLPREIKKEESGS